VYLYLLQHAESEPDTALLAINAIQKSLSAPDPALRALALRVMAGIRVPAIAQIVSLAIRRGVADMSPLVRRAAALAVPKCARLDPQAAPALLDCLATLLGDRQYYVAGAAASAFMHVGPDRIDLVHKHYRSLVRKLADMDEWGQLATLQLMTSYARRCFPNHDASPLAPTSSSTTTTTTTTTADFYATNPTASASTTSIDPDLALLLTSTMPLLQSRTSAVIVAAARLYLALAPSSHLHLAVGPLVSLLRGSPSTHALALHAITACALVLPAAFVPYLTHFLPRTGGGSGGGSSDAPPAASIQKLDLLALLFPHAPARGKSLVLAELAHAVRSPDARLAAAAVRALGRCAAAAPPADPVTRHCLALLLDLVASADDAAPDDASSAELVAEALTVVRHLVQADPAAHAGTVVRLARRLDVTRSPAARASIVWLVGEFAGSSDGDNVAADVLRILAKGFADEAEQARLQIVLLAAKVYLHHLNGMQSAGDKDSGLQDGIDSDHTAADTGLDAPSQYPIALLWRYILLLARYDTSYDLRDRARVYRALLAAPQSTQLATLLLLAPKPIPHSRSPGEGRIAFTLGSASQALGGDVVGASGLPEYVALPDWVVDGEQPDARLRADGSGAAATTYGDGLRGVSAADRLEAQAGRAGSWNQGAGKTKPGAEAGARGEKSLDDWLAESDAEEGSAEGDEESSSGEEGDTEAGEGSSSEEESMDEEEQEDDLSSSGAENDDDHNEKERLVK